MRSSVAKFTAAAAMIGMLAVAIGDDIKNAGRCGHIPRWRRRGWLGDAAIASATHSAPGYGYGPRDPGERSGEQPQQ